MVIINPWHHFHKEKNHDQQVVRRINTAVYGTGANSWSSLETNSLPAMYQSQGKSTSIKDLNKTIGVPSTACIVCMKL